MGKGISLKEAVQIAIRQGGLLLLPVFLRLSRFGAIMVGLVIRSPMKCSTKRSNAQTNQLQSQLFLKIASDKWHQSSAHLCWGGVWKTRWLKRCWDLSLRMMTILFRSWWAFFEHNQLNAYQLRPRYPKTSVMMPGPAHPKGFKSIASTYSWADCFIERAAARYGAAWIGQRLEKWKWSVSTAFSGLGCGESATGHNVA